MSASLHAPWRDQAACAGSSLCFDSVLEGEYQRARMRRLSACAAICTACPVQVDCREDIDYDNDQGVRAGGVLWGGELLPIAEPTEHHPDSRPKANGRMQPREHGTVRGYDQHRNRDDGPACEACKQAHRAAARARRQAQKEAA